MSRLMTKYRKEVIPALQKDFGVDNIMAVPRITKVTINTGIGKIVKDAKDFERVARDITLLACQKPITRKAKKSVSSFKTRQGMVVGYSVTLRGTRMYDFIDRLISIALPTSRDFRGIDLGNIDKAGNLNLGIREHNIFPEVTYESLKDIFGLHVNVTTTAKNKERGIALLRYMGFPLKK